MDFIDEVRTRSGRFAKRVAHLDTEEATKSALVLPFIQMLGYEIFDPTEVVPEFTADIGTKKGEKVDYALIRDGQTILLVECKKYGSNLNEAEISQLLRYFTVTAARFGVLTDGVTYRFFSDLDEPNIMDPQPFFEFNMLDFTEAQVKELKRFTKSAFDTSEIVDAARDLKYTTEIKRVLAEEFASPSEDLIQFVIKKVYKGRSTASAREMFGSLTLQALTEFINERIDGRLKSALERVDGQQKPGESEQAQEQENEGAVPVPQETEALQIVKALVRDMVPVRRISIRRYAGHCSILLDNSRFKVVCWLWFTSKRIRLGLSEDYTSIPLETLDDLYGHAEGIRGRLARILSRPEPPHSVADGDSNGSAV